MSRTFSLIFYFIILTDAVSIRERLAVYYNPNARCYIQIFPLANVDEAILKKTPMFSDIFGALKKFKIHNYTFVESSNSDTGYADENGTYDGMVGQIQRNEVDIGWLMMKIDSLPYEPVKFTAPILAGDVTIISRKNSSQPIQHELTKFLDIDRCNYYYFAITSFFMFTVLYVTAENIPLMMKKMRRRKRRLTKRITKFYYNTLWKIIYLIMDQEQFKSKTVTGRVLVLSLCLFVMAAIFGILLSTIGADLVARPRVSVIDSLDDLLKSPIKPLIVKKFWMYNTLKMSIPGTKINQLHERIMQHPNESIFNIDADNIVNEFGRVTAKIDEIYESKYALLLPASITEYVFAAACIISPKSVSHLYHAKEPFAPGILAGVYSNEAHPYIGKVWNYIFGTIFEAGLFKGNIQTIKPELPSMLSGGDQSAKYDSKLIRCIEGKVDKDENNFAPFSVKHISSLILFYLVLSLIALLIHFFTVLNQYCKQ